MPMLSAEGKRVLEMKATMERFIYKYYKGFGGLPHLYDDISESIYHLRFCLVGNTKASCCEKARALLKKHSISGEIILYPLGKGEFT
jgi:hypothetical protein